MKKEHLRDLSLLYYDFNNSKARLMSKMKKMSDFVIQEEEADGDGVGGQRPDTDEYGKKVTSPSRTSMNKNPSTLTSMNNNNNNKLPKPFQSIEFGDRSN